MSNASISAFLMLSLLAISSIIIYDYGFFAIGSSDMGVNLSGTQYRAGYNASVNTSVVTYSYLQFQPMLLGVIALAFMLLALAAAF